MIQHWVTERYTDHQFFGIGGFGLIETYVSSPTETVEEEVEKAIVGGGGWAYLYDYEYEYRKKKKKELKELQEKAERIQNKLDRELALELRKQEKEQYRIEELRRLTKLAEDHQEELKQVVSQKALKAVESAIIKQTYSAMERMEREIAKAREEEAFLMQAASIILNS